MTDDGLFGPPGESCSTPEARALQPSIAFVAIAAPPCANRNAPKAKKKTLGGGGCHDPVDDGLEREHVVGDVVRAAHV